MAFKPEHLQAGIKAALKSPKTPAHLKPHLQARLNKPAAEVQKPKPLAKQKKEDNARASVNPFGNTGSVRDSAKSSKSSLVKPDPFNPFYGGY